MRRTIYILLILLNCLTLFSQEINKNIICQVTFKDSNYEFVQHKIAEKWNLELISTNDSYSNHKKDSIKQENEKIWIRMDSIYGVNSEKRFYSSVNNEHKRVIESRDRLQYSKVLTRKIRKLKKRKVLFSIKIKDFENENKYTWSFYKVEKNDFKFIIKKKFYIIVYLNENRIEVQK